MYVVTKKKERTLRESAHPLGQLVIPDHDVLLHHKEEEQDLEHVDKEDEEQAEAVGEAKPVFAVYVPRHDRGDREDQEPDDGQHPDHSDPGVGLLPLFRGPFRLPGGLHPGAHDGGIQGQYTVVEPLLRHARPEDPKDLRSALYGAIDFTAGDEPEEGDLHDNKKAH